MRRLAPAVLALGLIAAPVPAQNDGGGFLETLIEDNLSGAGRDVRIRGFEGALSSTASLVELTIADENGVWLTLRDVTLDWNRSALLRGRLEVNELTAGEIILPRLPGSDPEAPAPEATPFALPELPVSVRIEQVAAARLDLGAALFGAAAVVSLNGSVRIEDGTGAAQIEVARVDGREGALTLDASYDNATEALELALNLTEAEGGIAANLLDLPGTPSVRLNVDGTGPLSDFTAAIELDTDGERRIEGTVALTATGTGNAVQRGFAARIGGDIAPVFAPRYRPFFGPDIRLIAEGATRPGGGFAVNRLDLTARALTLTGQVTTGADGLPDLIDLTGEIVAPGGGPVLLPIGGDETTVASAGLSVQFDASRSEDWTARVTLNDLVRSDISIGAVELSGTGEIADDGAGAQTVTADLDVAVSGLAAQDPAVQQALGVRATGAAAIAWISGGPVVLDRLQIDGASFALQGSGQVGFGDNGTRATLAATLQAQDLAAFSALAGRDLGGAAEVALEVQTAPLDGTFDLSLTGIATDLRVDQPQADALLAGRTEVLIRADRDTTGTRLSELTLRNPALSLDASGDLTSAASTLRADLRLADVAVLYRQLSGPVTLTALGRMIGGAWNYDVQASGVGAEIDASGQITGLDGPSPRITTETDASLSDLSRFSGLAGRDLAGALDLRLAGHTLADLTLADMSIDVVARGVKTGEARFDDLLVGRTDLATRVQREGEVITVQRFLLNGTGTGLRAEGVAQLEGFGGDAPRIRGTLEASANSLARFSALAGRPLGGAVDLTATGEARLDLSELDADLTLAARSVTTGMAEIDPLLAGLVELDGQVSRDGDVVSAEGLRLTAASMGLRLTGSARGEDITGAVPLVALDAALVADTLAPLSALAGRPLGGAVDVTLKGEARADLGVLDVVLDGQTRSITIGQENADRLLRGATELALSLRRDGAVINLPRLRIANDQIVAVADGRYLAGQSALKADVTIADLADLDARMRGRGQVELFVEEVGEVWQVNLNGNAADAVLRASAEVRDALSGNPTVTGDASLRAGDLSRFAPLAKRPLSGALRAEISGSARADLALFDITADLGGTNLAIGQPEADRLLGARTDIRVAARRGGAGQPIAVQTFRIDTPTLTASANGTVLGTDANLAIDARLADIGPYVTGLNGPVTVDGRVESTGNRLGLNLSGTGPGGITLRTGGTVQQDFSRANLSLSGQAPLALANPFIQPRSLDGALNFDVAVNGPLALSSVSGKLSSRGARLVAPALNIVLENIALDADLTGGGLQLNLTADNQGGGRLRASGPIALGGGFDADLAINAAGVVIEDPRLYRTRIDGDVTVNGPLTGGARIGGLLTLVETEVRIPSTGLGATGPIPDGLVHVNEPAAVRATRARAGLIDTGGGTGGGATARPYPLDLTIRADNRLFIRGRGLDAELGGALTLTGTTANVIPAGQFQLIRGRLDILGKRMDLIEGQVTLQGDFSPFLRLVASTRAGDVTVLITVEGSAREPAITFSSQPELPQEEVLARLLFGRALTSISPLQAAQLASAVATLAGRGGDGLIANLRKSTGLDDLDITTDDEGNAVLRAGKYLSENVYTDVTVGASGQAEINLNLDLTPNLTVKGSAGNSGETSLGIFFEKDY